MNFLWNLCIRPSFRRGRFFQVLLKSWPWSFQICHCSFLCAMNSFSDVFLWQRFSKSLDCFVKGRHQQSCSSHKETSHGMSGSIRVKIWAKLEKIDPPGWKAWCIGSMKNSIIYDLILKCPTIYSKINTF